MSPKKPRIIFAITGLFIGLASAAAMWVALYHDDSKIVSTQLGGDGWKFGNRQFIMYHRGLDARFASIEWVGREYCGSADENARRWTRTENQAWGGPEHWLRLPTLHFSLWIPMLAGWATVILSCLTQKSCVMRGFTVLTAGREA